MRVLYIFAGNRKDKFKGVASQDYPDTQFYGANHLERFGIEVNTKEQSEIVSSNMLRKILGFRLTHVFSYFSAKSFDVVFGSSLLYTLFFQKIYKRNAHFVLFNISLSRLIRTHQQSKFYLRIIGWLLTGASGVVCLSKSQQNYIGTRFPMLHDKLFTVPLGVDVNFYSRIAERRSDYVLAVGRDDGRDYNAMIEVARKMPDTSFQFVCSKRNIEGVSSIPGNVNVYFDLSPEEVYRKYREASVMLLLTKKEHAEGSDCSGQTVLLEAFASRLPVVVSYAEYLSDYGITDKHAVVMYDNEATNVAYALRILLKDRVIRSQMIDRAFTLTEEQFSTIKMAERLATVFQRVVSE